ncbi:MAG TPA: enoyl-[acyl-carrier-protein] reductase FabL [Anaerolineae bacterium]|nr:enoyl-[acyl-carrier-protein] reductase FabL [Anaerolineae bacterium]
MDNTLVFRNHLTLITGSGRGIGKEIAIHFAKNGSDIVINFFRNRKPAEETAKIIHDLGRKVCLVKANIGDIDELNHLFDIVETKFGYLDNFIHNAASGYNRPALEQRGKGWDWTMNINARSLLFAAQRAVPLMKKRGGGAIVSISSPGSSRVIPDYIVVGASKAALESITRYLAIELAQYKIVVNAVSPGIVLTDALKHFNLIRKEEDLITKVRKLTPAGRLVTPNDIAEAVSFLCSPAAYMIRGQTLVVDGGYTLPLTSVTNE